MKIIIPNREDTQAQTTRYLNNNNNNNKQTNEQTNKQTNKERNGYNQTNALKAFRLRERVSIGRLENEITRKMIEKRKLELEVMELNREIKETM